MLMTLPCIILIITSADGALSISETGDENVTPATMKLYNVHEIPDQSTSDSSGKEHIYKTDTYMNEVTDKGGLFNVTISEFGNSTEGNNSDIHSSVNIAVIPTVAVFLFIVIAWIKCCKWFRQYSRGGNKDDHFYAVIVTDDDKDYGHIDITSDTTSTACYDTVSSFTSFLKRSGNESTLSSIRGWHQDSIKSMSSTSSATAISKKNINCGDNKQLSSLRKTRAKVDESNGDFNVRISSTSSAETVSEQLTDSPAIKRNNRFRVSFVTETKGSASEVKSPIDNINHDKFIRSSLKKPPTGVSNEPEMVDVGTQTNKSFRYSLRKSKPHLSDSDIDGRFLSKLSTNTLKSQSAECQHKDNDSNVLSKDRNKNRFPHVKHSSVSLEKDMKYSHPTFIPEISKYPLQTNVEVKHHSEQTKDPNEDLELDDDVFVDEVIKDSIPHSFENQPLDLRLTSEKTYVCNHCKTKLCRNKIRPTSYEGSLRASNISTVIQNMCENCKLVNIYKPNVSSKTAKESTDELSRQNQSEFIEFHDRPSSTISQESSGYAELSSSESYSSFS